MTVETLWHSLTQYPDLVEYSLYPYNEHGKITTPSKMDFFMSEYGEKEVIEFEIRLTSPSKLYVRIHNSDIL